MRTTANAPWRRVRIRLRLDSFVPQATDIPASGLVTDLSRTRQATFPRPTNEASKIVIVINGTEFRGVITDWGGVLTTPILTTVQAWIQADGIDWDSYRTVMRAWVSDAYDPNGSRNPVHALERGECSDAEFEQILAAQLLRVDGGSVPAEGLLQRMFAASVQVPAMYELIRAVRAAGLRTALLSNSWGGDEYPRADFPGLFDAVVISGECGMRKPEQEIFRHAADPGAAAGAVRLHRRHRGEHGRGRRVRHDRRAPRRGGADGGGARGPARRPARRAGGPVNTTATRCDNRRDAAITTGLACQAWRTIRIRPARAGRRT